MLGRHGSPPPALRAQHEPGLDAVQLLDTTRERLLSGGAIGEAIDILIDGLYWIRNESAGPKWREVTALARAHPVTSLLHENPLLRRAFARTGGYAGDPAVLDMLMNGRAAIDTKSVSPLGRVLLDHDAATPFAMATRERTSFFAALIDHVAEKFPGASILAAGCGHFPEGAISRAVAARRIGHLVLLDRDADAITTVAREYDGSGAEAMRCGLETAMEGIFAPRSFDMIYVPAAYDQLLDRFATALTRALFELLRPGGRLVIANVVSGIFDAGYLEVFADWSMVDRAPDDMMNLASRIDARELAMKRVFTRLWPDISYLELRRKRGTSGTRPSGPISGA
jgi:extracellular factor (EF) 3-hydroxypalmitic acid methyl ester biosynthesis protein